MEFGVVTIANVASAMSVLAAVGLGALQIRQMRKTRALFTAAELVHSLQSQEFARSVRLVLSLPDEADPALIRDDPEMAAAVLSLSHVYESLGVLVFYRVIHLHLVDDLMGGYVRECWLKLAPYVKMRRDEMGVSYGEWFQWLCERMQSFPSPGKDQGAHVAHRGWRP